MSSLKDSDEQTSPPATEGSLGVQVASSHFSNISANNGNSGCLEDAQNEIAHATRLFTFTNIFKTFSSARFNFFEDEFQPLCIFF